MYTVRNSTAIINGLKGKYDNIVSNASAKYGRNAVSNYADYIKSYHFEPVECDSFERAPKNKKFKSVEEFEKYIGTSIEEEADTVDNFTKKLDENFNNLAPIDFEMQYMPQSQSGVVDKDALLGASFEEMGQKYSISVEEMNKQLNPDGQEIQLSSGALDINHDNNIDIGEYATSILLSDMLSTDDNELNLKNINGKITNKGENKLLAYNNPKNKDIAYKIYSSLYQTYNLGDYTKEFINNSDNIANA